MRAPAGVCARARLRVVRVCACACACLRVFASVVFELFCAFCRIDFNHVFLGQQFDTALLVHLVGVRVHVHVCRHMWVHVRAGLCVFACVVFEWSGASPRRDL